MTSYQATYECISDSVLDDDTILLNAEDDSPPPATILQFPEHNKGLLSIVAMNILYFSYLVLLTFLMSINSPDSFA